jgi:hypothetical protein
MEDDHWPEEKLGYVQLQGTGQSAGLGPSFPGLLTLTVCSGVTSRTTLWFRMRRSRAEAPRKRARRICRMDEGGRLAYPVPHLWP